MILFIDKEMAREGGMTHEGTVYGVPCWMAETDDPDNFTAVTKFYPMNFYLSVMDSIYSMAVEVIGTVLQRDFAIETPITVGEPI